MWDQFEAFLVGLFPCVHCLVDFLETYQPRLSIGCFVAVEEKFPHIFDKCMAKVLVELDLSCGLMD